jgi:sugar phosphate isomerase/epimerase
MTDVRTIGMVSLIAALACCGPAPVFADGLTKGLYVIDTGTGRDQGLPPEAQADLVKRTGYVGMGFTGTQGIPEMLKALDARGLKMLSIYVHSFVSDPQPSYDPGLPEAIQQLAGRETLILLTVRGNAPNGDERAAGLVRQVADMAARSKLRVCLYPHVGYYMARMEDALRIMRQSGRQNVGVAFPLAQWLAVGDEPKMVVRLKQALPHLLMVSIHGADHVGDWSRLIQPLGQGEFDVPGLLKTLDQLGYKGPVSLRPYQVKGDPEENLKRSMAAWKKYSAEW